MSAIKEETVKPGSVDFSFEEPETVMEGAMGNVMKPKGYKGEDPDTFLRGFARLARANKWDENRQLAILPALFTDTHEWLARELEEDASLTTMEKAKKKILERLDAHREASNISARVLRVEDGSH